MSELFESLDRESKILGETRDCAVKAVAIACGQEKDYRRVLELFRAKGRRNRGRTPFRVTESVVAALGCAMINVTDHFGSKTVRTLEREMRGMSGCYLIRVRGHVLSVVDGSVHDWTQGRCHRIQSIYKIKQSNKPIKFVIDKRERDTMRKEDYHKGMIVIFGRENGEKTRGEIVKCNPKTAKIKILEDRGRTSVAGQIWKVPYSLIKATGEDALVSVPFVEPINYNPFQPRVEQHILQAILCCYSDLSPENLSADGERPRNEVIRLSRELNRQLQGLFQAYGREVGEMEVYEWDRQRREHQAK